MRLRFQLLGSFKIWNDGVVVEFRRSKSLSLLKILLSDHRNVFSEEELAAHLWPLKDFDEAKPLLRNCASMLRRLLKQTGFREDWVQYDHSGYRFHRPVQSESDCTIDLDDFRESVKQAKHLAREFQFAEAAQAYEKALALYQGDFLPEETAEWALSLREAFRNDYLSALLELADCLAHQRDYRSALEYAFQALKKSPYREDILRQIMLYHYRLDNRNEALRLYEEYERTLWKKRKTKPGDSLRQLYDEILRGSVPWVEEPRSASTPASYALPYSLGHLPFVGRERQRAVIKKQLDEISRGQSGFFLIEGESGIGKTRLILEILQNEAQPAKALILQGRCSETTLRRSYHPIRQALNEYISTLNRKKIEALQLPPLHLAVLAQWLPAFQALVGPSDLVSVPLLSPERERWRLFRAIRHLLLRLGQERRPLVLFLDDLHWADASTVDLMEYLLDQLRDSSLAILGTSQPRRLKKTHRLARLLERRQKDSLKIVHLRLARLTESEVNDLLQRMAFSPHDCRFLGRFLYQKGSGIPRLMIGLLQLLIKEGPIIKNADGAWIVNSKEMAQRYRAWTLPENQMLVNTLIEPLALRDQQVLEILSVMGEGCHQSVLSRLWQMLAPDEAEPELLARLQRLMQQEILQKEGTRYGFVHDSITEGVYQTIAQNRRRELHRFLAEALEKCPEIQSDRLDSLLAHHYAKAGFFRQALEHALPAVQSLVQGYYNEEALALIQEALEWVDQLAAQGEDKAFLQSQRFAILCEKAKLCELLGRRPVQEALWEEILALPDVLRDCKKRAAIFLMRATFNLGTAHYPEALADSAQAFKIASEFRDPHLECQALHSLGLVHWRKDEYEQARVYFEREEKLQQELGNEKDRAEALRYLGLVSSKRYQYEEARDYCERALRLQHQLQDHQGKAHTLLSMGFMHWERGDYRSAMAACKEVHRLAVEIGDRRYEANALSNLGLANWSSERYERAHKYLRQAIAIHDEIRDRYSHGLDLLNLGLVHWALGMDALAQNCFLEARHLFLEIGKQQGEASALHNLGLMRWRSRDYKDAIKLIKQALKTYREHQDKLNIVRALRNLGETLLDGEDPSKSLKYLKEALALSREIGSREEEMLNQADLSAVYVKLHQPEKAVRSSTAAIKLLRTMKHRPKAPQMLFAHACALAAAGQKSRSRIWLERAHQALLRRAQHIRDATLRRSFLGNVPPHREIVEAHRRSIQNQPLSEAACYALLRQARWPEGARCPYCEGSQTREHGLVRRGSPEKRYLCQRCRKPQTFSDRTETPFAFSNLALSKLFQAWVLVAGVADKSSAVQELQQTLGVHYTTALRLYTRLQRATEEAPWMMHLFERLTIFPPSITQNPSSEQ